MKMMAWILMPLILGIVCSLFFPYHLEGRILNERGHGIAGATVVVLRTNQQARADARGQVSIPGLRAGDSLLVEAQGYRSLRWIANERGILNLRLDFE